MERNQQEILGWLIDLDNKVYLVHPNHKFWECSVIGKKLTIRVGKLQKQSSEETQTSIEEVEKQYSSNSTAKKTAIEKIEGKLVKGYEPKDGQKAPEKMEEEKGRKGGNDVKKERNLLDPQGKNNERSKVFSGQYYQKGDQSIKLQVNDKRVKITKIEGGKEGYQIRSFDTYDDAVDFCLTEESWMLSDGYRAINSKFIYSFIDDFVDEQKPKTDKSRPRKKQAESSHAGLLSVTGMTDNAISHRSRNASSAKSDRSYEDNDEDNSYLPSRLGAPTSGCIKVLLAETWNNDIDPTGYIMSEKLDGVRCFWTGTTMYSRNGNRFFFPKFFTRGWPKSQLDGQLFIGRGKFSETISAIKKGTPINSEWQKVRYLVFDCPGLKQPFKKRLEMMEKVIKEIDNPYIKCHGHRQCKGYEDLFHELDEVNKIQGEGLMLRDPESKYENRRSKTLLKVKTFHDDEAVVIGYKKGTGRCQGMVGALRVRNTHGVEFQVGSGMTDEIRKHPPKIGSKITYKYQQFNKDSGKPRFPTYMRKFDKI